MATIDEQINAALAQLAANDTDAQIDAAIGVVNKRMTGGATVVNRTPPTVNAPQVTATPLGDLSKWNPLTGTTTSDDTLRNKAADVFEVLDIERVKPLVQPTAPEANPDIGFIQGARQVGEAGMRAMGQSGVGMMLSGAGGVVRDFAEVPEVAAMAEYGNAMREAYRQAKDALAGAQTYEDLQQFPDAARTILAIREGRFSPDSPTGEGQGMDAWVKARTKAMQELRGKKAIVAGGVTGVPGLIAGMAAPEATLQATGEAGKAVQQTGVGLQEAYREFEKTLDPDIRDSYAYQVYRSVLEQAPSMAASVIASYAGTPAAGAALMGAALGYTQNYADGYSQQMGLLKDEAKKRPQLFVGKDGKPLTGDALEKALDASARQTASEYAKPALVLEYIEQLPLISSLERGLKTVSKSKLMEAAKRVGRPIVTGGTEGAAEWGQSKIQKATSQYGLVEQQKDEGAGEEAALGFGAGTAMGALAELLPGKQRGAARPVPATPTRPSPTPTIEAVTEPTGAVQPIGKPVAYRIRHEEDGTTFETYVDATTGEPVSDPSGYEIREEPGTDAEPLGPPAPAEPFGPPAPENQPESTGKQPEAPLAPADRPSPNLPPRAASSVEPRPTKATGGKDWRDKVNQWDEQYGDMRKGGRTHNDDGTPVQPTVYDEVAGKMQAAGFWLGDAETRYSQVGTSVELQVPTAVKDLINDGWVWDDNLNRMVNPRNPSETPSYGLERIAKAIEAAESGATQQVPAAQPQPQQSTAPVEPEAKATKRGLNKAGQWAVNNARQGGKIGDVNFAPANIRRIARDNGIQTEGKTPEQLLAELDRRMPVQAPMPEEEAPAPEDVLETVRQPATREAKGSDVKKGDTILRPDGEYATVLAVAPSESKKGRLRIVTKGGNMFVKPGEAVTLSNPSEGRKVRVKGKKEVFGPPTPQEPFGPPAPINQRQQPAEGGVNELEPFGPPTPAEPLEPPVPVEQPAEPEVLTETTGAGRFVSKRKVTREGVNRVEAARQRLRDIINNPDIVGRQRADMIENGRRLISFLDTKADTRRPLETDYVSGDLVAFTGEDAPEGFRAFIYLEGARAGEEGVTRTKESKAAQAEEKRAEFIEQQAAFRRVRESSAEPPVPPAPTEPAQQRDVSKPEQMTPEEHSERLQDVAKQRDVLFQKRRTDYEATKKSLHQRMTAKLRRIGKLNGNGATDSVNESIDTASKRIVEGLLGEVRAIRQQIYELRPPVQSEVFDEVAQQMGVSVKTTHGQGVRVALAANQPVSSSAVDTYGITLPPGYVKQGELYVYRPQGEAQAKAEAPAQPQEEAPKVPAQEPAAEPAETPVAAKEKGEGVEPETAEEAEVSGEGAEAEPETDGDKRKRLERLFNAQVEGVLARTPALRGEFDVAAGDKKESVNGTTLGALGVHKNTGGGYTVTHLASGFKIGPLFDSQRAAMRAAAAIQSLGIDMFKPAEQFSDGDKAKMATTLDMVLGEWVPLEKLQDIVDESTVLPDVDNSPSGRADEMLRWFSREKDARGAAFAQRLLAREHGGERQVILNVIDAAERGAGAALGIKLWEGDPIEFKADRFAGKPLQKMSEKTALYSHASEDTHRPVLQGVFHDPLNQVRVSSDGRRMLVVPSKVDGKQRIIGPDGNEIDGAFPNWKAVVPKVDGYKSYKLDADKLLTLTQVGGLIDRAIGGGDMAKQSRMIGPDGIAFKTSYLQDAVRALRALGATDITLEVKDADSAAVLRGNNGAFAVVMPVRMASKGVANSAFGTIPTVGQPTSVGDKPKSTKKDVSQPPANILPKGNVQTVTDKIKKLCGGKVPARIEVVYKPAADYNAYYDRETGKIVINAATVTANKVFSKLVHELSHLLWHENPEFRAEFSKAWDALSDEAKGYIWNLVKERYSDQPLDVMGEEAHANTLDMIATALGEGKVWDKLRLLVKKALAKLGFRFSDANKDVLESVMRDVFARGVLAASNPRGEVEGDGKRYSKGDVTRFNDLTADLYDKTPEPTQEDIDAWKAANPEKWEELSKMRERVLKEAGYNVGPVWRGEQSGKRPTVYGRRDRREYGIFTAENEDAAAEYDKEGEPRKFFIGGKTIDLTGGEWQDDIEATRFIRKWSEESGFDWFDPQSGEEVNPEDVAFGGRLFDYEGTWSAERWNDLQSYVHDKGYDAVRLADTLSGERQPVWVALDSNAIKSADPISPGPKVTPDQWGDASKPDIRYSKGAATQEEVDRFMELVKGVPATPKGIAAFKRKEPEAYAELEKMRETVLRRAGYNTKAFHGTRSNRFSVIDFDKSQEGFHLGSREAASQRAKSESESGYNRMGGGAPKVFKFFIRGRRFLRVRDVGGGFLVDWIGEADTPNMKHRFQGDPFDATADDVKEWLGKNGYDGIVYYNQVEDVGSNSYIVFDKHSAKSADPLHIENGKFIPPDQWAQESNPDIRYSRGDMDDRYADLERLAKAGDKDAEAEAQRMVDEAAKEADSAEYRGAHTAPDFDSASGDDLTRNGTYPADVYSRPDFYEVDEGLRQLRRVLSWRGNPDLRVRVWRALPKSVAGPVEGLAARSIRRGDWVTISKQYAQDHGESALNGDFVVVSRMVRAGDIYTNGDSIYEWGYYPQEDTFTYDSSGNLIPLSQRFQTEQKDIRYSRGDVTPPAFYSQLGRVIERKMPNAASPQQVKASLGEYISTRIEKQADGKDKTIVVGRFAVDERDKAEASIAGKDGGRVAWQSQNQIKEDEVKWSGIVQAIDRIASENGGKVPKSVLQDYLRDEGAVKFEEVTIKYDVGVFVVRDSEDGSIEDTFPTRREAENFISKSGSESLVIDGAMSKTTKYDQYTIPGGENYREVVLAMPVPQKSDTTQERRNELVRLLSQSDSLMSLSDADREVYRQRQAELRQLEKEAATPAPSYTSSHFPDVPNYVAHMRLNEREDAEGKPGLFIEEIQSDRHQAGKKNGYAIAAGSDVTPDMAKEFFGIEDAVWNAMPKDERQAYVDEIKQGGKHLRDGVPDAPFRKDWPLQMFKRALRDAVASGKEWIGWTTGETQADRYDLSKQVDSIEANRNARGEFEIRGIKDGSVAILETATAERLPELVGSELAQKIIEDNSGDAEPYDIANAKFVKNNYLDNYYSLVAPDGRVIRDLLWLPKGTDLAAFEKYVKDKMISEETYEPPKETQRKVYSGNGLKVGGSGMKGFYDNILPKEVGKYVKQWGGVVEQSSVGQSIAEDDLEMGELDDATPEEIEELRASGRITGPKVPIWRVNITPAMREGVRTQGQVLYSRGDVVPPSGFSRPPALRKFLNWWKGPGGGVSPDVVEAAARREARKSEFSTVSLIVKENIARALKNYRTVDGRARYVPEQTAFDAWHAAFTGSEAAFRAAHPDAPPITQEIRDSVQAWRDAHEEMMPLAMPGMSTKLQEVIAGNPDWLRRFYRFPSAQIYRDAFKTIEGMTDEQKHDARRAVAHGVTNDPLYGKGQALRLVGVWNAAKNYVKVAHGAMRDAAIAKQASGKRLTKAEQALVAGPEALTDAQADARVASLTDPTKSAYTQAMEDLGLAGLRPNRTSLLPRKNIPYELRQLMGEVRDPTLMVEESGNWYGQFIAQTEFMQWLRDYALEQGWIKPKEQATGEFWVDLTERAQNAPELRKVFEGYVTTPEFADALTEMLQSQEAQRNQHLLAKLYAALVAFKKEGMIVLNPRQFMQNLFGGIFFATGSGAVTNLMRFQFNDRVKGDLDELGQWFRWGASDVLLRPDAEAMQKLGIDLPTLKKARQLRRFYERERLIDSNVGWNDIRQGLLEYDRNQYGQPNRGDLVSGAVQGAGMAMGLGSGVPFLGWLLAPFGAIAGAAAGGQNLRGWMDNLGKWTIRRPDEWVKMLVFASEYGTLRAQNPEGDKGQQMLDAAKRARGLTQQWETTPAGLKQLSKYGVSPLFVSFFHQLMRAGINAVRQGAVDVKDGVKAKNAEQVKAGLNKLASASVVGWLGSQTAATLINTIVMQLMGGDDEPEKLHEAAVRYQRSLIAPYDRGRAIMLFPLGDGKVGYLTTSSINPYGDMTKMAAGVATGEWLKELDFLRQQYFELGGIPLEAASAVFNWKPAGGKISKHPNASWESMAERGDWFVRSLFRSGIGSMMTRMAGRDSRSIAAPTDLGTEALGVAGARVNVIVLDNAVKVRKAEIERNYREGITGKSDEQKRKMARERDAQLAQLNEDARFFREWTR